MVAGDPQMERCSCVFTLEKLPVHESPTFSGPSSVGRSLTALCWFFSSCLSSVHSLCSLLTGWDCQHPSFRQPAPWMGLPRGGTGPGCRRRRRAGAPTGSSSLFKGPLRGQSPHGLRPLLSTPTSSFRSTGSSDFWQSLPLCFLTVTLLSGFCSPG